MFLFNKFLPSKIINLLLGKQQEINQFMMMNGSSKQQTMPTKQNLSASHRKKSKSPLRRSPIRKRSPQKQSAAAAMQIQVSGGAIIPYNQVNDVRCFVSKTNPSQVSPSQRSPSNIKSLSGSIKKDNMTSAMKSNSSAQISGATTSRLKRQSMTSAKKLSELQLSNNNASSSNISPSRLRSGPNKFSLKHQVTIQQPLRQQHRPRNAPFNTNPTNDLSLRELDSANVFTPADESLILPIDSSKLHGLQRDDVAMMSMRKAVRYLENKPANIFARKSLTIHEISGKNGARIEKSNPSDFQIQMKEESMLSIDDPCITLCDIGDIGNEGPSPETLQTQIGIEETNIKTIGVSGTKPKVNSGSLTERQTHLLMLSQASASNRDHINFGSNNNQATQLETSVNGSTVGPSLPSRRFEKSGGPHKVQGMTRAGTVDYRGFQKNDGTLTGLQASLTAKKEQGILGRRSLANSQDRSNSIGRLHQTQVSPFQQQVLIHPGSEWTNTDFTTKVYMLKNLDKIDLSSNKITKIPYPELLNHTQTLIHLCLDSNKISEIAEETLRQVPLLSTLKLKSNHLNRLPDSLFSLAKLKVLDVSSNRLTAISAKVSLLRQLRQLNIAENKLEGLPNSIGYLDLIESVTSEYFVYLNDQSSIHISNNVQHSQLIGANDSMPTTSGDPELDWITRNNQKQTIARIGADARFEKLMTFMRLQIEITSSFLNLVHEFQHVDGDYYKMLDSEPVMPTEESEDLHIHPVPSFNQMISPSQIFTQQNFCEQMTPTNLVTFSKYLPKQEYNELVTVFRTLEPDPAKANATMLHTLIQNNHPHLLKQFYSGIQATIQNTITSLESEEASELFHSSNKKIPNVTQQGLIRSLQQSFVNKLRQAVNSLNDRGSSPLDLVLHGAQVEIADNFILQFGKHIELDCNAGIAITPSSEIRVIIPGNQQNNTFQEVNDPGNMSRNKLHPIVTTLTNGRFQLASKLIDVALDCYFRHKAEERLKSQQDQFMKDPAASHYSLYISSSVMNHAALQGQFHRPGPQTPFSLNVGDSEVGMTFLHHLFSNYDLNPEKAGILFRKMNSLHLRPSAQLDGRATSPGSINSFSMMRPTTRAAGHASPMSLRSKMKSDNRAINQNVTSLEESSKFSASAKKFALPHTIFQSHNDNNINNNRSPRLQSYEIKPLELNLITHYFETPYELAIEHFQNQAIQFALNWNYNHLQSIQFAHEKDQRSQSANRSQNYISTGKVHKAGQVSSEPTVKDFFDIMSQNNPRKLTPLHRTVICGNFNALKLMLDSPLCNDAHILGQKLKKKLKQCSLIDLHAQDKFGKTARDYSHKIVFMSKLLNQAYSRQVWRQANLAQYQAQIRQKSNHKNNVQKQDTGVSNNKSSVLATYDKLISHVARNKSKPTNLSQAIQGGGGNLVPVRHTCLNLVFLKANDRHRLALFNKPSVLQKHNGLTSFQFPTASSGQHSSRSQGGNIDSRRLVKSFAALGNPPVQKIQTPFQVKTATGVILTPNLLIIKKQKQQQLLEEQIMFQNTKSSTGVHRQSVPSSTKGIKKAKSMAFNSLSNRLDRDSQARQFLNQAMQTHQKLMKSKQLPLPYRDSNMDGIVGCGVSEQTPKGHLVQHQIVSGSQSHLGIHHDPSRLSNQESQSSIRMPGTAKEQSLGEGLESRYGTSMVQSSRETPINQTPINASSYKKKFQLLEQSMDREAICNEGEVSLGSVEVIDSVKKQFGYTQQANSIHSPTKFNIAVKTTKGMPNLELVLPGKNALLRSVKVDKRQKLDQSLLALSKSKQTKDSPSNIMKSFVPQKIKTNQSDALKLADLEVIEIKKNQGENSMEMTHDFDDSGSANSFTPLPSIQNYYALEIKSFNNQWKKPYSQQLSTNFFKDQFDQIMDNQCGDQTLLEDEQLNNKNLFQEQLQKEDNLEIKALKPHQKIQILFEIIKSARHPHKLQDAKDIFDFIQYEIGTQTQQAGTRNISRKEVSDDVPAPNAVSNKNSEKDANISVKKTNNKIDQRFINNSKNVKQQWPVQNQNQNQDIIFLRQEVSYLRCQLDLIAKQMVAIPLSSSQQKTQRNYQQDTLHRGFTTQTSNKDVESFDANDTSEHVDMEEDNYYHQQLTERQEMNGDEDMSLTQGTHISHYRKNQHIFSTKNPSIVDAINLVSASSQKPYTGTDHLVDEAHLTEADQEFSDDFDENVNTVKQPLKKQQKSRLVKPSDMLGGTKGRNKQQRNHPISQTDSWNPSMSKLGTLLLSGSSGKKEKPQKLKINGVKLKTLKQLDKSHMQQKSRENLETDEGQTVINQPFISAELQSFSDRLSQQRGSANTTNLRTKKLYMKKQSLLEMASKQTQKVNQPGGRTQRDRTPTAVARVSDLANDTSSNGGQQQPKLKYAAFAQIDLSSFDFQKKQLLGLSKNEPLQEKSRSVIAIPKCLTFTSNTKNDQLRSVTRMSDQLETKSQKINQNLDSSVMQPASGAVLQTEERQIDNKFMMIQEEMPFTQLVISKKKSTLLERADSFKQINQTHKAANQFSLKKKTVPSIRKPLSNLGTLTSQKISLKVLQDYQKNNYMNRSSNPVQHPTAISQKSTQERKYEQQTAAQPLAMTFSKAQSKLNQLTINAINLPPQTAKSGSTHPQLLGSKVTRNNPSSVKSTYLQPKVVRSERPNNKILSSTTKTNHKSKASQLQVSRNVGMGSPKQSSLSTTGVAPTKTLDGFSAQLKIKPHHKLLKDLIDNPITPSANSSNRPTTTKSHYQKQ